MHQMHFLLRCEMVHWNAYWQGRRRRGSFREKDVFESGCVGRGDLHGLSPPSVAHRIFLFFPGDDDGFCPRGEEGGGSPSPSPPGGRPHQSPTFFRFAISPLFFYTHYFISRFNDCTLIIFRFDWFGAGGAFEFRHLSPRLSYFQRWSLLSKPNLSI